MKRVFGTILLLTVASVAVWASTDDGVASVPEIDAASGGTVVALLSGAMLMLRARRKR